MLLQSSVTPASVVIGDLSPLFYRLVQALSRQSGGVAAVRPSGCATHLSAVHHPAPLSLPLAPYLLPPLQYGCIHGCRRDIGIGGYPRPDTAPSLPRHVVPAAHGEWAERAGELLSVPAPLS
jgi:hypothetical protein